MPAPAARKHGVRSDDDCPEHPAPPTGCGQDAPALRCEAAFAANRTKEALIVARGPPSRRRPWTRRDGNVLRACSRRSGGDVGPHPARPATSGAPPPRRRRRGLVGRRSRRRPPASARGRPFDTTPVRLAARAGVVDASAPAASIASRPPIASPFSTGPGVPPRRTTTPHSPPGATRAARRRGRRSPLRGGGRRPSEARRGKRTCTPDRPKRTLYSMSFGPSRVQHQPGVERADIRDAAAERASATVGRTIAAIAASAAASSKPGAGATAPHAAGVRPLSPSKARL